MILIAALLPGAAQAAGFCTQPSQAPTIDVTTVAPEVDVDHSLSKAQLARFAVQEYGYVHHEGSRVFGLTAGRVRARLSVHTLTEKRQSGQRCVWPSRLIATVKYEGPITVHLAREHRRGSCQHKAVLDHEMEHVAVLKAALPDYAQRLRKALQRALDRGRFPYTGRDAEKVQARLEGYLETAFRKAVAEAEHERDRANAAIDTPENYRRTRRRCATW